MKTFYILAILAVRTLLIVFITTVGIIIVMEARDDYSLKNQTIQIIKSKLNFTPSNLKKDFFVSDALGECDAVGTETAKIADVKDQGGNDDGFCCPACCCEMAPVPVSDASIRATLKEYKIFGLTIFRSKKTERD